MNTRRKILAWAGAYAAAAALPFAYQRGRAHAQGSPLVGGRFFGYVPFTQPLYIPPVLTPLKGAQRLNPAPGYYRRGSVTSGRPTLLSRRFGDVAHGIAPEFGHVADWNRFRTGFSRNDTHEQEFGLVTEESTNRFVPGGPDVPVFTYRDATMPAGSGRSPGPTIVSEYRAPVVLRSYNALTRDRARVNSTHHDVETSVHLHGSHGTAHGDGFPDFYVLAGEARDYFYPNIAPRITDPGTLVAPVDHGEFDETWIPSFMWYHDHVMDLTGFNVAHGLAGINLVFDDRQRELAERGVIPPIGGKDAFGNPLDFALVVQDQRFNADGTIFFDFLDHNGRLGDVFLANGVVQPKHTVERRKYRIRFLNGSNARIFELRLSNRQKMTIIGTDTWLLPRAIEVERFQLTQGQRHDVIIDFRNAPDEVYLENILLQTDGRGAKEINPDKERDLLVKFEVRGPNSNETRVTDGTIIRGFKGVDPGGQWAFERDDEVVARRSFEFERSLGAWVINGKLFNPRRADAVPELGYGAERWTFKNGGGGWWHPIHTHLEGFQIKRVNGRPPRRERQFNSDLVALEGGFIAEVLIKFRTFTGPYAFHCHAMEHEDMRMMMVMDPTPGAHAGAGAIDGAGPLDGQAEVHSDVSGVVASCNELDADERIFYNTVGDLELVNGRGVGFPNCTFDRNGRGNG
jgi:FtsP/CotA-like multicopper oxidase with cupredoxin domain